jgi:hypothetical protein
MSVIIVNFSLGKTCKRGIEEEGENMKKKKEQGKIRGKLK